MQQYMKENIAKKKGRRLEPWELRAAICTGPIVAGVVGKKKYAYDIWGSTVNIASRMEFNGDAGMVNVLESTYQLIKDKFSCSHRGKSNDGQERGRNRYVLCKPINHKNHD